MTRGDEIALGGDTGGDVTSPRSSSRGQRLDGATYPAGCLPCPPAGAFSGGTVARFARDHRVTPRRRLRDMRADALALKARGMTWAQVGDALGVNGNSLHVTSIREGWRRA